MAGQLGRYGADGQPWDRAEATWKKEACCDVICFDKTVQVLGAGQGHGSLMLLDGMLFVRKGRVGKNVEGQEERMACMASQQFHFEMCKLVSVCDILCFDKRRTLTATLSLTFVAVMCFDYVPNA